MRYPNPSKKTRISRPAAVVYLLGILALCNLSAPVCVAAPDAVATLRKILEARGVAPLQPAPEITEAKWKLGQALFYDPVVGGNRDVSCATCHHPSTAAGDGRSRAVGTRAYVNLGRRMPEGLRLVDLGEEGPVLTGFSVNKAAHPFTPRNSPEIFNRGDPEWRTMFWDSRVYQREDGRFVLNRERLAKSPGYNKVVMPEFIENVLAAQAMMPVLSSSEMRGTKGEMDHMTGEANELGNVLMQNNEEIWAKLMKRILSIEEYRELFQAVYPDIPLEELHFGHAANVIAAFEIQAFTLLDSPFDKFLDGDDKALSPDALKGAHLFYGRANCVRCHSGSLMTDQRHHNMGIIPIGPGPAASEDMDFGIAHRSDYGLDRKFHFRTPPLRNVELTFPYMHNGAYTTLEAAVRHMLDPVKGLENYDPAQLEPEFRGAVHNDKRTIREVKKTMAPELLRPLVRLEEDEIGSLLAFLKSLTSPSAHDLSDTIPESVPSGLEMVLPFPEESE